MTIDPDGAMHDWVDLPAGWSLIRIPTQEAVLAVGIRGYQELLVDVCRRERPEVLVTHPPYDYLDEPTAARIRDAGTRLVGYAFDDEIFAGVYPPETRAALGRMYDRYVITSEVRWATRPLDALPARAAEHDVALVGRAYPRRVARVEKLRAAGFSVVTRGAGWPEGPVSRAGLIEAYAAARVVLTTAGWESRAVPMVKHRLLDTAMLGAFQLAEDAPDLRAYFPAEEVPSYRTDDELIDELRAALAAPAARERACHASRARALAEHTWTRRFPELVDGLALRGEEAPAERSLLLDQLLLALATRAEADGRIAAAGALFAEVLARVPDEPTAAAGVGRCRRDLGDLEGALAPLRLASASAAPTCLAAVDAAVTPGTSGTGLGRLARFPPATEPLAYLVAALIQLGRIEEADATLAGIDTPALAHAVAATLAGNPGLDPRIAARLDELARR
jgi:hypothetical protein